MSIDYLLAIGACTDPVAGAAKDWRDDQTIDLGWAHLVVPDATAAIRRWSSALLIGTVHELSGGLVDEAELEPLVLDAVAGGEGLFRRCWGQYLLGGQRVDGTIILLRDPSGGIPCYWHQRGSIIRAAADARLLVSDLAQPPGLHRDGLGNALRFPDLRTGETAIAGVHELPPGAMLTLSDPPVNSTCWPSATVRRTNLDPQMARLRLRRAVVMSVGTQVGASNRPLLQLSGGLNSSILAFTLKLLGRDAVAVNVATPDAEGDERRFARQVAEGTGLKLIEHVMTPADINIVQPTAPHLPRPTRRLFAQAVDRLTRETARAHGCDMLLSGGGGDNVFGFLPAGVPTADAMARPAPASIFATAMAEAEIYGTSLWSILKAAGAYSLARQRWVEDRRFLHPSLLHGPVPEHPWLGGRSSLPLGRRAHLASLALIQNFTDALDRSELDTCFPLLSQPVMELCLSVRTSDWVAGGHNRALARDAFADVLPDRIRRRRGKGGYVGFAARLYDLNRATIRDLLLGGLLAADQYLDRLALERWFASGAVPSDNRLLSLVEAETWARHWTAGDGDSRL